MSGSSSEVGPDGRTVLVVDDDSLFRETIGGNLCDAGFRGIAVAGGGPALEHFQREGPPAAVLLDWDMPDMDGIEVLRRIRAGGYDTPILFLTGLTAPIFEERALAAGAVDFVDKSKSFGIILQRLRLVMGGTKGGGQTVTAEPEVADRLEIHPDSARAFWKGEQVSLTLSEFKVVKALAARGGRDMSYREIYDLVRGEGFHAGSGEEGYRSNVRALIKRIRQKFRDIDPDFEALENYAGFGYRWRDAGDD
ncbi:MAG: response regulator [Rhodospirillaceae bacterium]|nr:response regulator [Rhodospirillaceae bacterium]